MTFKLLFTNSPRCPLAVAHCFALCIGGLSDFLLYTAFSKIDQHRVKICSKMWPVGIPEKIIRSELWRQRVALGCSFCICLLPFMSGG